MKKALLFTSMLMAVHAGVGDAAPRAEGTVVIRTYNYAGVSAAQFAPARTEAEHIFRRAGITVEWTECRVPGEATGSACTQPLLAARDLMLRLVDRVPVEGERVVALGESMLDREQRSGVLMTIDLFPVRTVAARTSAPMPTLLGRTIAHEIGHLLLRSGEHPRMGLMRALWSSDELRGVKPAHWEFSSREAALMRQTLRDLSRNAD
jgi:hypothetical protein